MSDIPSNARAIPLDDAGMIASDVPCIKCGYNLRGLDEARVCPECGTSVAYSLRGFFLRFRSPEWLSQIAAGPIWIFAAIAIAGLSPAIVFAFGTRQHLQTILESCMFFVDCLLFIGAFKITTPEPGANAGQGLLSLGRIVRLSQGLRLGIRMIILTGAASRWPQMSVAFGGITSIALFVFMISMLIHLRRLAQRIPSDSLATVCRITMWAWIALLAGIFSYVTIQETMRSSTGNAASYTTIAIVIAACTAVPVIISLILILWVRRELAIQSSLAHGYQSVRERTSVPNGTGV